MKKQSEKGSEMQPLQSINVIAHEDSSKHPVKVLSYSLEFSSLKYVFYLNSVCHIEKEKIENKATMCLRRYVNELS